MPDRVIKVVASGRQSARARGTIAAAAVMALITAGCGSAAHSQQAPSRPTSRPSAARTSLSAVQKARQLDGAPATLIDPLLGIGLTNATDTGPSGVPMPTGNLKGWKQVFADDFPAAEDTPLGSFKDCAFATRTCSDLPAATAAKWFAYPDGVPDTWGEGRYTPSEVVSIHDGLLDVDVHTSPQTGVHEVAALEPKIKTSNGLEGMRYGAYAVRFRTPSLPGYEAAWQLWPDSHNGLGDGEIGFPAGPLSGPVLAWLHWSGATSESMNYQSESGTRFGSGWHTAVLERTPKRVRFILDGRVISTYTKHLPTVPMYWVLQTEVEQAPHTPAAGVSGHIDYAWAAAYAWDPQATAPNPT